MRIARLALRDFRNYERLDLDTGQDLTILVGPNAAGKTNALEALQLLTAGRSFRGAEWADLVRRGADRASARIETLGEDGRRGEVRLEIAGGKRAYLADGKPIRRVADLAGRLPAVSFTPDDLGLVKGAAERRRAALDDLGAQLSKAYASAVREYGRVLRQRNVLLREGTACADVLGPIDEVLAASGGRLVEYRVRLLARVAQRAAFAQREVCGETLALGYVERDGLGRDVSGEDVPAAVAAQAILAELRRRRNDEVARGTTLAGPHRDDVAFLIDGADARAYASQGQQRTAVLAWKLAEVSVIEEVTGRTPVLLLDDVMSELDERRRAALTSLVRRNVQTFVSTTNPGYFAPGLLERATVVELGGGGG